MIANFNLEPSNLMNDSESLLNSTNADSYDDLMVSIQANQRQFNLLIGVCDHIEYRDKIIKQYETELNQQIPCYRITLAQKEPSLRAAIATLVEREKNLQQQSNAVITVTGTEQLYFLPYGAKRSEQDIFLGYLQWTREALRQFPFSIVLWVTHQLERTISKKAPDFWSWRKGVFRFTFNTKKAISGQESQFLKPIFPFQELETDDYDPYFLPLDDLQMLIQDIEQKKGLNDLSLVTLYGRLGKLYKRRVEQGECENYQQEQTLAIEYFQKAIQLEEMLGLEENLATFYNELSSLYSFQGKYKEAEQLCIKSLQIAIKTLGEDHPSVVTTLSNLASIYRLQGNYKKAELLFFKVLELIEKNWEEKDIAVSNTFYNLAMIYYCQERYQESEYYYLQTLEKYKTILGENNPNIATVLDNLGTLYHAQRKYKEAELFFLKALQICKKQLGENHKITQKIKKHLSDLKQ